MALLAINAGSSGVKYSLFAGPTEATAILTDTAIWPGSASQIVASIESRLAGRPLAGIVHRLVHGGERFREPVRITREARAALQDLIVLAPNHLPGQLALIDQFTATRPDTPQFACFDTAFHAALPPVSRTLPVPAMPGVRRYGFHGLSYAYLLSELARTAGPDEAAGRVILAHLGSGASLAAISAGRCIDTSMGLTPTGGLLMGSRTGDLDPGVITHILRSQSLSADALDRLLTHDAGLKAISGGPESMTDLLRLEPRDPRARLAVDMFCYQVSKWIGAFAAALAGLDTLVFSGGIGEHADVIRARVCAPLTHLGITLDAAHNAMHAAVISNPGTAVTVRVIPTDEALMMVRQIASLLGSERSVE